MPARAKSRPPFAWLGRHMVAISAIGTFAIDLAFRCYRLQTLPPGIDAGGATIGLQALGLGAHHLLPNLDAASGYAPLWVWLQALAIHVAGHTALALRLWPVIVGALAVPATWLWLRGWFGLRVAWITAFLLAVTPWAVTLSRSDSEAALWPLLTSLTLWLATRAWHRRSVGRSLLLALVLALDLLSGPVGWLIALVVVALGASLLIRERRLRPAAPHQLAGVVGLAAGLVVLAYLAGRSPAALQNWPKAVDLVPNIGAFGMNLGRTLFMFNVAGDQNWRHNLAGEPLLNAFVGLMFVAGLVVSLSRLHQRKYRLLMSLAGLLLIPAIVTTTGAPNAARAAAALPAILTLAAIGISYMLELWYQTFPINSAARTTGQAAILILLGLTMFQGFTQYFHAWAGSSAVYAAHNESAMQMSTYLRHNGFTGPRYVVAGADEMPVVAYLDYGAPYTAVTADQLSTLNASGHLQFLVTAATHDSAAKSFKTRFPGGVLYPHYSTFNQAEIYYTYEVTK